MHVDFGCRGKKAQFSLSQMMFGSYRFIFHLYVVSNSVYAASIMLSFLFQTGCCLNWKGKGFIKFVNGLWLLGLCCIFSSK